MDWRERNYYWIDYSMVRQPDWKSIAKSIKLFPPYNHVKAHPGYDPCFVFTNGAHWANQMLSCRKSDAAMVEEAMQRMEQTDSGYFYFRFVKLSPEMCGQ